MNLDELQKLWQSQDAAKGIPINTERLLHEVRRKQHSFRRTIFWRDTREVGVAALLVPVFLYGGWQTHWTLYLCAVACFVVGAFMVIDRRQQKKKIPDLHGSLKDCAATALAEVNHQIWLLKNVVWWYLLPLFLPMALFFGCVSLSGPGPLVIRLLFLLALVGFVTLLYAGIYWINQAAVRKSLEPRRQELVNLLGELETKNHVSTMNTKKPLGPLWLVIIISIIAFIGFAATNKKPMTRIPAIGQEHPVPALAVVVTKDGQIRDRIAAGVRKWGDTTPVTTNDVFHIGSCTKSMTATLAAILIEQGKLRWDTTIGDTFPELRGTMDQRYAPVTIEQLLHHRGGVPNRPPPAAWQRAWKEIGTPMQQRREYLAAVLSKPPEAEPGTKKIYSNDGYAIAGAMLEKIARQEFESLMTEELFKPLRMDSAGFGPPGTKGKTDQPWGHTQQQFRALPKQSDNPPVLSPAGRVHCTLDDLARYAMFHLQSGSNSLLKPETMAKLHASPSGVERPNTMDDYAMGWVRLRRPWAGGPVLWHNGSNTMWYMVMWLAPEKDFSVIAVTNIAGNDAEKACDDAVGAMIEKWLSP